MDRLTGGAFGDGVEQNVRTLYRFLVFNYEPGDEIYLFGFSRGAFTVRTLAGFINRIGLLQKNDEYYTAELYALYESSTSRDSPEWEHAFRNIKDRRPPPPIRFIGVWDTVGALGAPLQLTSLASHSLQPFGRRRLVGTGTSNRCGSPACTRTSEVATARMALPTRHSIGWSRRPKD